MDKETVAKIVAWLRDSGADEEGNAALRLADEIESGIAPPFAAAERADVLAVAAVPPRALRAIAAHLTRCAVKHGVEPHQTRPDRDAQAHMAGADRHLLRMARKTAPGYDLDAIDEDSGAPQLVAWASRAMLTLECWLVERERKAGASS